MKKKWNNPEITVLVRTRPEEAVLATCKAAGLPSGPMGKNNQCQKTGICKAECLDAAAS